MNLVSVTYVYKMIEGIGSPKDDGIYDGLVGYLQRNVSSTTMFVERPILRNFWTNRDQEADYGIVVIRPDTLIGEPVLIGPTLFSAEARLYSVPRVTPPTSGDVTDVVYYVDGFTYFSVFIIFIIIAVLICYAHPDLMVFQTKIYARVFKNCWEIFRALIRQEHLSSSLSTKFERIIWFFVNLSLFVIVSGFFLNRISGDLVVQVRLPIINKLSDLSTKEFEAVRPIGVPAFQLYTLFANAPKESDMGKVYKKMERKENLINNDREDYQKLMPQIGDLGKYLLDHTAVFPFIKEYMDILRPMMCRFNTKLISTLHMSDESFGNGVLNTIFSRFINPDLRKPLEFAIRHCFETGIFGKEFINLFLLCLEANGFRENFESAKCSYKLFEKEEVVIKSFKLEGLTKAFDMWRLGLATSFVILIAECVWHATLIAIYKWAVIKHQRKLFRKSLSRQPRTVVFVNNWTSVR